MAFHKKLNTENENTFLGITKIDSGCCAETGGECGYIGTITGAPFLNVTFVDSKGVTQTATFENAATDAATLETELRKIFLAPEPNPSDPNSGTAINGMGTIEKVIGGISAVDNGADVDLELITDVVITLVNGVAMTQDCTTQISCDCQIIIGVGADVSAVELGFEAATDTLTTGTYATGEAATLKSEMETAATSVGINYSLIAVTEDLDSGTFIVKISHLAQCSEITWNEEETENCGCSQKYHV